MRKSSICDAAGRETTESDSSNKSRAPRMERLASGKHNAVGDVSLGQRGRKQFAGEVGSFVGVTFSAPRPAAQAKRNGVLAEDVRQAFDFAGVGDGNQDSLAVRNQLLYFFQHGRNRAVEAWRGLGVK